MVIHMDNRDYSAPNNDYSAPEENWNQKPIYETAEEYNQAQAKQEEAADNSAYAYTQFENNSSDYSNQNYNNQNYSNQNYNNQNYNYQNYNNQSYSNPYNNGAYGNNYNANSYYGGNYNDGRYTNINGIVIDSNGKPLKNHFGIQLTCSIIEMVCCCCFNCITFILGIIACVFTCLANGSYKNGRFDSFKSQSRTATILLIIGAALAVITAISNMISSHSFWNEFEDAFNEEFEVALEEELGVDIDMDTFWQDYFSGDFDAILEQEEELEENYHSNYNENAEHENFEDFNEIIVDGVSISLPCTYANLQAAGFYIDQSDLNEELASYEEGYYELHTKEKTYIADVQLVNLTEESCKVAEATVIYLDFYYESVEEKDIFDGYEFVNGLTMFASADETLSILGEPNSIYMEEMEYADVETYIWEYEYVDGYYSFVGVTFYDGVLYDIEINNGPSEY